MAGRDAARVPSDRSRAGAIATDQARRLAERREAEIIGIFLMPLERRPLAVYPQPQIILIAGRNLTRPQHAARALAIPQHDVNVVIEPPSRHEDREIRGNLLTSQTGDKCGKMVSVAADVTKASCRPAARRVSAPFRLLLVAAVRVPLSGAVGGRFAGDIVLPLMGRDLCIDVKARADGYCELFCWLNERGLLIVKADRQEPLVVVRLSLAAEIAKLGAAVPVFGIGLAVENSLDIGVPGS
jgi:hypothetical protein